MLTRHDMSPPFEEVGRVECFDYVTMAELKNKIMADKDNWNRLIQDNSYKYTAKQEDNQSIYNNFITKLESHLKKPVKLKTNLDFFVLHPFNAKWETEPSGFIHNDWSNYSICIKEFCNPEDIVNYDRTHAIAIVLPVCMPEAGSGLELYDSFYKEPRGTKELLHDRAEGKFDFIPYTEGEAVLFCPFRFHSGYCAKPGTLKDSDTRIVMVAFLIRYKSETKDEWHVFRNV